MDHICVKLSVVIRDSYYFNDIQICGVGYLRDNDKRANFEIFSVGLSPNLYTYINIRRCNVTQ